MTKFNNFELAAPELLLNDTKEFVTLMSNAQDGIIRSRYKVIDGLKVKLQKGDRAFTFETESMERCGIEIPKSNTGYGFFEQFDIATSNGTYVVKNGIGTLSTNILNASNKGQLWDLEASIDAEGYFQAMLPCAPLGKTPVNVILGSHFRTETFYHFAGLINIEIDMKSLSIFVDSILNVNLIFIRCNDKTNFQKFQKIVEAVLYSFGFVSGTLLRDEITIIRFNQPNFTGICGFQFTKIENSIISPIELICPKDCEKFMHLDFLQYLPSDVFAKMVSESYQDERFLRVLKIINQSRELEDDIQAASIFVALETSKEIIITANKEKSRSFKNAEFAEAIINRFLNEVNNIQESEFLNKNRVLSKIATLNQIGNNEGFFAAFDFLGLELSANDKECIKMRNRFLHGNIPFANSSRQDKKFELKELSLHIHLLVCALIMKYVGFSGAIFDFGKYWDQLNNRNKIDRPLFKII